MCPKTVAVGSSGQCWVTLSKDRPGHDLLLPALTAAMKITFLGLPAVVCKYSISLAVLGRLYAQRWYSVVCGGSVEGSGAGAAVLINALGTLIRDSCESRLAVLIDVLGTSFRDSQGFGCGLSCMSLLVGIS